MGSLAHGQSLAEEPHMITPNLNRKLINTLGLSQSVSDWQEPVINILIVGKDGKTLFPYPDIADENGRTVSRLASRADATILLSFNKITKKTTVFSLVRDNFSEIFKEILAHVYILNGRSAYISEVKRRVHAMAVQNNQYRDLLTTDNQIHIHGMIEIDFDGFMTIVDKLQDPSHFLDGVKLVWSLKSHAKALFEVLNNRHGLLKLLRARQNHAAGSYQRSLNHALFLNSIMALLGQSLKDSGEESIYDNTLVKDIFMGLSRTFDIEQARQSLKSKDTNRSVLESVCINKKMTNSRIVLLGVSDKAYAVFEQGRLNYFDDRKYIIDSLLQNLELSLIQSLPIESSSICK